MDYTESFLPELVVWITSAVTLLILALVISRVDWVKTFRRGTFNVWAVSVFALAVVWMIRASIDNGMNIHILGTMLFTLMFGWRLGVLGISLVSLLVCLWGNILPANLAAMILINAVFAVTFCYFIFLVIEAVLPHNLYIYLYLSAFFGSALSYSLTGTLSAALLGLFGAQSWSFLIDVYLPLYYLMSFAESFLTCGLLTMFVVYRPAWVFSFRDERYLTGK